MKEICIEQNKNNRQAGIDVKALVEGAPELQRLLVELIVMARCR
jgi:hypothetical protein